MYYEVVPTKIFRNGSDTLTYSSNINLKPGNIVVIPLGKTSCPGIVLKKVKKPTFETREIKKLLYPTSIPDHLLKSLHWLASFYLSPLPSVASLFLPIGVEKNRRQTHNDEKKSPKSTNAKTKTIPLNKKQLSALKNLESLKSATRLLFGITGSGKTNIYLKLAAKTLKNNKSIIILVPEIALTSQLVSIFKSSFEEQVILIHSRQTESERHRIWEKLLLEPTHSPKIIIGPRSALFAPLNNLGLIIIDEAHESAYYQENSPKYSSVRLASFIAKTLNIPCILGTATPLVSDFYLASKKNSVVFLKTKAKETAIKPEVKIIDFKSRKLFLKNRYFSDPLLSAIKTNLENKNQTLIFHNRRGSAPMTICENCGWEALCPRCFLPLTLHSDSYSLICHTCGYSEKIPMSCPNCNHPSILHKGFGTKLLESELSKLFKNAHIMRFDADNKKTDSLETLYEEIKHGKIDIIIGTQVVARGFDLPHLATIGIVQADNGLSLPDFSAEEKTFELLTQVIGRVGRGHLSTASVFIQTYKPTSPIINFATNSDYESFYTYELKKRQKTNFPPFVYLARLHITNKTEKTTISKIQTLKKVLSKINTAKNVEISSPSPAFHEHTTAGYTWQLILKSKSRTALTSLLNNANIKNVKITLDPPSLL